MHEKNVKWKNKNTECVIVAVKCVSDGFGEDLHHGDGL